MSAQTLRSGVILKVVTAAVDSTDHDGNWD